MSTPSSSGAIEAVERIINLGGEADDVLRKLVDVLHERTGAWVGIAFVEDGRLELGPSAGGEPPAEPQRHDVEWQGGKVAELQAGPEADAALLARVAVIISPYCLVAWDTGGEAWKP